MPKEKWIYQRCKNTASNYDMHALMSKLQQEVNTLNFDDPIETWEQALADLENKLHPNNYLCMNIKRTLIQLYRNQEKFQLPQDLTFFFRKLDLCENYINLYTTVDIGYSSWRGKVLEEMVGPFLLYNKSLLMTGEIDNETYVKKCIESIKMIKDASKCRQYEPQLPSNLFSWCLKDINDILSGIS